ncbi:STAS domain-containing protein [Pseudonocardia adelaidensis]|uniref:STAS domain-containing protein n=1 Tax=Pseudonocardia adelaidensis TaxID=648754 RepID=A0ABP9NE62_9PSEU
MDLSALVPAPRRESHPAVPDQAAPDRDEPLDVRLHAPTPDTVIVRVAGALHLRSSAVLMIRVRQQLYRAPHVILDLTSVTWVDVRVAGELRALHARAAGCGTHLHIAAENERVVDALRRIGLREPVVPGTADAVLACLAPRND